jgi:hypothetical protein
MINFEGHGDYPCQILLFYQKDDPVDEEATGKVTSGIHAVVNSCVAREGTSSERMKNMQEKQLCTRWELESNPKEEPGRQYPRGQHPNVAVMYSVPVEAIQKHVYAIEESPGLQEEWIGSRYVWTMNDQ